MFDKGSKAATALGDVPLTNLEVVSESSRSNQDQEQSRLTVLYHQAKLVMSG